MILSAASNLSKKRNAVSSLNTGLISYYDSGATDRKGSNDLTAVNAPTTGTGIVSASCMSFASASSQGYKLLDASAGDFEPNQTMSYACWFKATTLTTYMMLHSKGSSADSRSYVFSDGAMTTNWGSGKTIASAGSTITTGTWYHMLVSWNASTNTLSRSINGATPSTTTGAASPANSADFNIGYQTSFFYWDGLIDQFCLWHRELTSGERSELYGSGSGIDFLV